MERLDGQKTERDAYGAEKCLQTYFLSIHPPCFSKLQTIIHCPNESAPPGQLHGRS